MGPDIDESCCNIHRPLMDTAFGIVFDQPRSGLLLLIEIGLFLVRNGNHVGDPD